MVDLDHLYQDVKTINVIKFQGDEEKNNNVELEFLRKKC